MKNTLLLKYYSAISTFLAVLNEVGRRWIPVKCKLFDQSYFLTVLFLAGSAYFIYRIQITKRHLKMMAAAFYHFVFNSKSKAYRDWILSRNTYELVQLQDFNMLSEGLELDADTYDQEHTWTRARWRDLHTKNPGIAYGLFRRDDVKRRNLGGISLFPLTNEAYDSLVSDRLRENDLTQNHILSPGEEKNCKYWLIPGAVIFENKNTGEQEGIDKKRNIPLSTKAASLFSLFVVQIYCRISFPVTFIAVGYSDMGILLLSKMRFKRVEGSTQNIYSITFSSASELFESSIIKALC